MEELGHMKHVDEDITNDVSKKLQTCYYIPYNAMRNENSTTTKLRVVSMHRVRWAQASA